MDEMDGAREKERDDERDRSGKGGGGFLGALAGKKRGAIESVIIVQLWKLTSRKRFAGSNGLDPWRWQGDFSPSYAES